MITLKSVLKEYVLMSPDKLLMTTTTTQNSGLLRWLADLLIPDVPKERTSFILISQGILEPITLILSATTQKARIPNNNTYVFRKLSVLNWILQTTISDQDFSFYETFGSEIIYVTDKVVLKMK